MIKSIRCSKLARPMVCAGYLSLELPEDEPNDAAKEGTAAGEYLERLLMQPNQELPKQARNGVYFDDDMRFYTVPIAERIRLKAKGPVLCEQRIDWQTRSGIWIEGTYDISYECENDWLHLPDLKYGWGIVEVKENWQLLGYAIGEVMRRGRAYEKIILSIEQPRPHHEDGPTREWVLSYADLLAYKERIEQRMEMLAAGDRSLQTSKQCKYCKGTAEACPAFNRLFYRSLEISTEFTQDRIGEDELARQLDHVARAVEVIKIKSDSLKELAVSRIKNGKIVPGYITESSFGDRSWKPGIDPGVVEVLTGKKITEQVMLSPAKAEKAGVHKDFVNSLVDRKFLGQRLVKKDSSKEADKIFGKASV